MQSLRVLFVKGNVKSHTDDQCLQHVATLPCSQILHLGLENEQLAVQGHFLKMDKHPLFDWITPLLLSLTNCFLSPTPNIGILDDSFKPLLALHAHPSEGVDNCLPLLVPQADSLAPACGTF